MTTPNPTMTPQQFINRWRDKKDFGERQASQPWFLDVLKLVGHPDPIDYNNRNNFTFEKDVPGEKGVSGVGHADAYKQGHFGWEFKGSAAALPGAFNQLQQYQNQLQTPPLLIVSSFQLIRLRTNFNGKETQVHEIPITELAQPEQLQKLRDIFFNPAAFEPGRTVEEVTRRTAALFGKIASDMEGEDVDAERLARYFNQLVFCLYAENTELLPEGVFTKIAEIHYQNPSLFNQAVRELFAKMSSGGLFGMDVIPHFNGDLFDDAEPVELNDRALFNLSLATQENWRNIEPSIFGTLFEAAMDASKRSQLGAHYTSADDIMTVIEPVIMKPLRQEWQSAKAQADALFARNRHDDALDVLDKFRNRLVSVTVLDPACGSGNFLYLALRALLDLEKQAIDYAAENGNYHDWQPRVSPAQMRGLELDPYAAELARTALWIGYIQWHQANGIPYTRRPILTPLDTIRQTDAILDYDADGNPLEPTWPDADFIVGNPPFLGYSGMRANLGNDYTDALFGVYGDRLPNASDLCCYWLEKACAQIAAGKTKRAGLLATQGIRGRDNRAVLQRIKDSGDIFMARSDEVWPLAGAMVHISIIGFDDGSETEITLDGEVVSGINANLTTGVDVTTARILRENAGLSFEGPSPKGSFDIPASIARLMLSQPLNVNGKPNSDVIKRVMSARDIAQIPRGIYTIDFGVMEFEDACQYEMPFGHVEDVVRPQRINNRLRRRAEYWWQYGAPATQMRQALQGLSRYIATPRVSKHRLFVWVDAEIMCNDSTDVFASDDDYFFGILHSRIHELWARSKGTQLREVESGFRYTPTTCFETFPFPRPDDAQRAAIAAAAQRLDELRNNWLNPAETDLLGKPAISETERRRLTLTNLYNSNPAWLQNAHAALDAAVAHAYGWQPDLPDRHILANLLALNARRHAQEQANA